MFDTCLGIISFEDIGCQFGTLCKNRPAYMLPFAGRYRLVDFTLSNMINHGMRTISVFTGKKTRSTFNHLGDGKPWELNRRMSGLSIFPPLIDDEKGRLGDVYQYYMTEDFLKNFKGKYIFITNPNVLSKINLTEAFEHFVETDSDITLIYKRQNNDNDNCINTDKLNIDEEGRLVNIGVNLGLELEFNMYMQMAFIKKEVFLEIIRAGMETGDDLNFKQAMLNKKDKYYINSFEFEDHVEYIKDTRSYYNANMNLLKDDIFKELFFKGGTILTKSKDEPSTFYPSSSRVRNSLIANGCIIEGEVENSILFRGVKVGKNTVIRDSIVMQKSVIEEDVVITNAILDKNATVRQGVIIVGTKSNPYVVGKGSVIIKE